MMCISEVPFSTSTAKVGLSRCSHGNRNHPLKSWCTFEASYFLLIYILGVFNKSIFFRLDRICEDCYSLFREVELHSLCKWVSCSNRSSNFIRFPSQVCLSSNLPFQFRRYAMYHATNIRLYDYLLRCGGIDSICILGFPIERLFLHVSLLRSSRANYFNFLCRTAILKISHFIFTSFFLSFEKGRFTDPLTHEICIVCFNLRTDLILVFCESFFLFF